MEKTIILNWLPPASTDMPSPAMTVLKGALQKAGFECKILYWNILLDDVIKSYLRESSMDRITEADFLGVFYAYLALKNGDQEALIKQEILLKSLNPQYFSADFDFKKHIIDSVTSLEARISEVMTTEFLGQPMMVGFSMNLFQWVPASILAKVIKEKYHECPIAVGGIGNPKLAKSFLDNFNQFDVALWGEGEFNLVELARNLDNPGIVPNIVFRNKVNQIEFSTESLKIYPPLAECASYDFDDYFTTYKGSLSAVNMTIEGSRGCHWCKCKFCFLNQGYRYRVKAAEDIASEIRKLISKYNVYTFSFLDNDIIGKDLQRFYKLLSLLVEIRQEYPDFKINLAEIITQGISKDVIKNMSLAGFTHVQIGYESVSDNILVKINKKNSFASNLLFIKWASFYNIKVIGLNVLRGLLDETEEDILESIDNLYFIRFFKGYGDNQHNVSMLAVNEMSRYYKELSDVKHIDEIYIDPVKDRLPKGYVHNRDEFLIYQPVRKYQNLLWANFISVDNYYDTHRFSYSMVLSSANTIEYREKQGDIELNVLSFDKTGIHWQILEFCNEEVRSIESIRSHFKDVCQNDINDAIQELNIQGLLYYSKFRQECVSVVNTNNII